MTMTASRCLATAALAAGALATTGCGLSDPYAATTPAAPPAVTVADAPRPAPSTSAARTPADAIRRFTTLFINWHFDQLPQVKTALAAQATGSLRDELLRQARDAQSEVSRRASNQANTGTVEVVNDPHSTGRFYVVTRETAQLGDARSQSAYLVYTAAARRSSAGLKVSAFRAVS
jgi:hypothetical protein